MVNNKKIHSMKLPMKLQDDISLLAQTRADSLSTKNDYQIGYKDGLEIGIDVGATIYAAKMYQAHMLLKRFMQLHEAGLLQNNVLYDDINEHLNDPAY